MPFSACTQRTSFPDQLSNIAGAKKPLRPAVVIRRARLLSALGSSCEDTLRQLASAEDLCAQLAPSDVRVPESDLAEADRRIAEAARTTGLKAFTRPARSLRLAASAALPLLDEALQAGIAPADIGLIVGNTAAGTAETVSVLRSHPETEAPDIGAVAALTARLAGISGPAYCVSTACTAGSKAILEGARLLLTGRVRAVVAGGIDAESPLTEAGFSALGARSPGRALPFDARRTGMHLGEGGGFLLMMLAQTEQAYFGGMPDEGPEVRLAGWGETSDAHHICAPHPEGAGARAAIEAAIRNGAPHPVGFALLHGTATAQNDAMEARAMMSAAPGVSAASLKRHVGHQLAGAGAFNAAVAWSLLKGLGPTPLNFSRSSHPDPELPAAFRAALSGPENTSSDPMRFVDTALYADDCAAESVTLVRADSLAADACGRFPAVALIEIMAQTIGIYAGRLQRLAGEPPVVGLLLGTRRMSLPISFFTPGDKLFCRVQKKFESDEGLWQFDCEVMLIERASGVPCRVPAGSAALNVFNPPAGYFERLEDSTR